jgi:hypothetical protein
MGGSSKQKGGGSDEVFQVHELIQVNPT